MGGLFPNPINQILKTMLKRPNRHEPERMRANGLLMFHSEQDGIMVRMVSRKSRAKDHILVV